ncbi:MAG: polymer-forming cytoskeletal protein [Proteobacteria bacterium]|nr:polymer-forming cytoskeletal protein [Pseudomonadota bacterium]
MSETIDAVRRTASQPMSMLKAVAGMSGSRAAETSVTNTTAAARSMPTVVSASTEIKGSITTNDNVEIRGAVEGDVHAPGITVCQGGKVKGDLTADIISVQGHVEGRLQAQDVRLAAGANVAGEIVHGSLGIDTAAEFEGTIKRIGKAAATA